MSDAGSCEAIVTCKVGFFSGKICMEKNILKIR